MVRKAGASLVVRIPDDSGPRSELGGQESVVDAKPIAAIAVPGKFAALGMALPPQIAKADRRKLVQVMGRRVDRAGLIEIARNRANVGLRGCDAAPLGQPWCASHRSGHDDAKALFEAHRHVGGAR